MHERRLLDRVTPGSSVSARIEGGEEIEGRVVDISPRGARVELARALEPGRDIELTLHLGDADIAVQATVRHCREATSGGPADAAAFLHGVEFASPLGEKAAAQLDRELLRRSAERSKGSFVFEN